MYVGLTQADDNEKGFNFFGHRIHVLNTCVYTEGANPALYMFQFTWELVYLIDENLLIFYTL